MLFISIHYAIFFGFSWCFAFGYEPALKRYLPCPPYPLDSEEVALGLASGARHTTIQVMKMNEVDTVFLALASSFGIPIVLGHKRK